MSQFAAVVAVVFAILGFAIVAYVSLGVTLALLLYGFRVANAPEPPPAE